jgi:hypothetical protein
VADELVVTDVQGNGRGSRVFGKQQKS